MDISKEDLEHLDKIKNMSPREKAESFLTFMSIAVKNRERLDSTVMGIALAMGWLSMDEFELIAAEIEKIYNGQ